MTNEFDAFNFDTMKEAVGIDPFAQTANKYAKDERFYTLTKDKDGNGAALIRFLPDSERHMIQKMFKINTTIVKNGKKRFVNEFTPATIGQPCPFQEEWQKLWNAGIKEDVKDTNGNVTQFGAKTFGRGIKYVANIKVLNDPANPENNGKIFLYEFSGALNTKLENALNPSPTDIALGKTPKQVFNPLQGNSFRLVAQKGSNNQINYDASEVVPEVDGIYASVEEAITDIKDNTHSLSDLIKPESFMTYEQLQEKFRWVTVQDNPTPAVQAVPGVQAENVQVAPAAPVTPEVAPAQPTPVAPVAPVQADPVNTAQTTGVEASPQVTAQATPAANTDLDSLLNGLMK